MVMIIISIIIGCIIGAYFPIIIPQNLTIYVSAMFVVGLDAIFTNFEKDKNKVKKTIIFSILNLLLAWLIIFVSEMLNQSLYIAVCIPFVIRIFNNLSKNIEKLLRKLLK